MFSCLNYFSGSVGDGRCKRFRISETGNSTRSLYASSTMNQEDAGGGSSGKSLSRSGSAPHRSGRPFSRYLIDLDSSKEVNDPMGHFKATWCGAPRRRLFDAVPAAHVVSAVIWRRPSSLFLLPKTGRTRPKCWPKRFNPVDYVDPMTQHEHIYPHYRNISACKRRPPHNVFPSSTVIRVADAACRFQNVRVGNRVFRQPRKFASGAEFCNPAETKSQPISRVFLQRRCTRARASGRIRLRCCVKFLRRRRSLQRAVLKESRLNPQRDLLIAPNCAHPGHGDMVASRHEILWRAHSNICHPRKPRTWCMRRVCARCGADPSYRTHLEQPGSCP